MFAGLLATGCAAPDFRLAPGALAHAEPDAEAERRAAPSVRLLGVTPTGVLFSANAVPLSGTLLLTAAHVDHAGVFSINGRPHELSLVDRGAFPGDRADDWAIVRARPPIPFPAPALGDDPALGEPLTIRGIAGVDNPDDPVGFPSFGAVERTGPAVPARALGYDDDPRLVYLDAPVYRSLSGSAVLDARGELVGVVTKASAWRGRHSAIARRLPRDAIARALGAGDAPSVTVEPLRRTGEIETTLTPAADDDAGRAAPARPVRVILTPLGAPAP